MFWLGLSISSSCHYKQILHYACLVNCGLAIYFSSKGFLKQKKSFTQTLFYSFFSFCRPVFWTLANRQITESFSDLGKKDRTERKRHSPKVPFCQNHSTVMGKEGEGQEGIQGEGVGWTMVGLVVGEGISINRLPIKSLLLTCKGKS